LNIAAWKTEQLEEFLNNKIESSPQQQQQQQQQQQS
jgi:hypothetical protein